MTTPRRLRLTRAAFTSTSRSRKSVVGEHFSLSVNPSLKGGAAAVISKKVAKRSVDRHLLKRRVLEALRPHIQEKVALIVYARAGAPTLSYRELKKELESLLSRV